jgi:hypothetical protein
LFDLFERIFGLFLVVEVEFHEALADYG